MVKKITFGILLTAFLALFIGCEGLQKATVKKVEVTPLVETTEGPLMGAEDPATSTIVWKGIPYARPPVGELRWRVPQAPEKRSSVFKADSFCSLCPQYVDHDRNPATPQIITGNEDCLYLNIWAPKGATGDLPVFFWIHGGGNSIQWPPLSVLPGSYLASKGKMVVVTFNYRLGPLGFMNHPALKNGHPENDSGNFTLLDQIAALKWVKANISKFGGDPNNITIAGESAGGQDVLKLIASPLARGLFQRAVSQSGVVRIARPEEGTAYVNGLLVKMLVKDGKAKDEKESAEVLKAMSFKEVEAYLRSKAARDFLEWHPEGKMAGMIRFPQCFSDGYVLPKDFYGALEKGNYSKVPMILGSNREEAKVFLRSEKPFVVWRTDNSLLTDPAKTELFELVAKYQSAGWKVMAVDYLARTFRSHSDQPPIYAYEFLWGAGGAKNNVIPPPLNVILGACHAMEIDFVFGTEKAALGALVFNEKNRPGRTALSRAMMDYWSTFARTGNPNRPSSDLPVWMPWSNEAGGPKTILLDATLEKAAINMSSSELTEEMIEASLKKEPRQKEIQPFWDTCRYRMRR
ncbi:MAG TPA: carboxylesterase family protein [Syntrophales bacterium]|nr:carboxylesterase family protein [Syntrophales bacterium]HOL58642.1 carboxylesterase family protein [Syntrophales bacterium]HPO35070.1 carboxylesterase family protein [Syntrophales bacterium]